ncbi:hypothetical protein K440DRAFT_639952 [Wilcoxina mikolae CBS 423.85]|nr:hypothetical protein K440DRAFT_639952 [Wilcoxina mikolae CBS 423.85]
MTTKRSSPLTDHTPRRRRASENDALTLDTPHDNPPPYDPHPSTSSTTETHGFQIIPSPKPTSQQTSRPSSSSPSFQVVIPPRHIISERALISLFHDLPPFPRNLKLTWNRYDEELSIRNRSVGDAVVVVKFKDGVVVGVHLEMEEGGDDGWARLQELKELVGMGMREVPGRLWEVFKWD